MKIDVLASEACPEDTAFVLSSLSHAEEAELARRVANGEAAILARVDIAARSRKAAVIRFGATPPVETKP
jgi:hypothetical protein